MDSSAGRYPISTSWGDGSSWLPTLLLNKRKDFTPGCAMQSAATSAAAAQTQNAHYNISARVSRRPDNFYSSV